MKKTLLIISCSCFVSFLLLVLPSAYQISQESAKNFLHFETLKKQKDSESESEETKTTWNSLSDDEKNRIKLLAIQEIERYAYGQDYVAKEISKVSDFAGNDYAFVSFSPMGYVIYNLSSGDFVEVSPFGQNPFLKTVNVSDRYYSPLVGFFRKENDAFVNVADKTSIKGDDIARYKETSEATYNGNIENHANSRHRQYVRGGAVCYSSGSTPHYPVSQGTLTADHEVPYSWFFKLNNSKFAAENVYKGSETPHWECGYVAGALLLSYQEFFKSTGYFNAYEVSQYINAANVTSYTNGIPDDIPEIKDDFLEYFWNLHQGWGSTASTIKDAVHAFMHASGKNRVYEDYCYTWIGATVTDPIKDGVPDILFGNLPAPNDTTYGDGSTMANHVVVVYGYYNDGKLLVHYGWDGYSQVILTTPNMLHLGGVYAIYNKSAHVHNRYFKKGNLYYCGCGALMSC